MSLIASSRKNAVTYYANFIVNALVTLFATPFLVANLGVTAFGIWKACQKMLDVASVADGRSTQALKWVIATQESSNDRNAKQRAVGSAVRVWLAFFPVLMAVLVVLVLLVPLLIKGVSDSDAALVRTVALVLGLNVVLSPLLSIPDALLIGTNRGYRSVGIQTFWLIASNFAMVFLAVQGYGLVALALTTLLASIANALCVFAAAKASISWLGIQRPTPAERQAFTSYSAWVWLWAIVEKLLLSSEVLLLGLMAGADAVAKYSFTTYVIQFATAACLLTGSAVTPGLGKLIGARDTSAALRAADGLREIVLAMATVLGGAVLILNRAFVGLWMGAESYIGDIANAMIVMLFMQLVLIRNEAQIHDLGLDVRGRSLVGILSSLLGIAVGAILYMSYESISSVLAGLLLGRFLLLLFVRAAVNKEIGRSKTFRSKYLYCAVILSACAVAGSWAPAMTWVELILLGLVTTFVLIFLCSMLLLTKSTRNTILGRVFGLATGARSAV